MPDSDSAGKRKSTEGRLHAGGGGGAPRQKRCPETSAWLDRGMRSALSFVAGAVVCAGLFLPSLRAQDFTRELSPEEQAAIGLGKLTPAERSALIAVVERYRERSPAGGRPATDAAEVSRPASPGPTTVAPATAVAVATPAAGSASQAPAASAPSAVASAGRSVRAWIPFLKDKGEAPAKPKPAPAAASDEVVTRLTGELRSFNGRRSFVLENGEVWEMDEVGGYSGPVLTSPEVILRPGVLGTHILKIPDAALRVRVRRGGPR